MSRARAGTAGDDDRDDHVVHEEWESVRVHRAPRVGRIMGSGLAVGLALAVVFTAVTIGAEPGGPLSADASGALRVFGVLALVCVGAGLFIAGLVVIVLDRMLGASGRPAIAERATTLTDDLVSPVTDEVPRWVRDAEDLDDGRT